MSNRFYVDGQQIFGNNELPANTYQFLNTQGVKWIEDGWVLEDSEIKDPQGLMDAVTKDTLEILKKYILHPYNPKTNEYENKAFEELTDIDVVNSIFNPRQLLNCLYTKNGEHNNCVYIRLEDWITNKRAFTPYYLWIIIKDKVERVNGVLTLKPNETICVSMF